MRFVFEFPQTPVIELGRLRFSGNPCQGRHKVENLNSPLEYSRSGEIYCLYREIKNDSFLKENLFPPFSEFPWISPWKIKFSVPFWFIRKSPERFSFVIFMKYQTMKALVVDVAFGHVIERINSVEISYSNGQST